MKNLINLEPFLPDLQYCSNLPNKTAAALPEIWWSNCSTYGYGEIVYYGEYCYPKAEYIERGILLG